MAEKDRRFRKSESALLNAFVSLRPQGPVSVSDIIREADVSKATFYLHYASVRELANAALDLLMADHWHFPGVASLQGGPPGEFLFPV